MLDGRAISAETALGDGLMFTRMSGVDQISRPFRFVASFVSEDWNIDPLEILGTPALIELEAHVGQRYFSGLVGRFELTEPREGYAHYRAELRPWLWFLRFRRDCRIFQNMTAVEIIEAVFGDYAEAKYELRLMETYPSREYCVQYDESDLDFVSRLMEHEGVHYFFVHAEDGHTLVLADNPNAAGEAEGYGEIPFREPGAAGRATRDHFDRWVPHSEVRSGAFAHTDYDFEKPKADLMAKSASPLGHKLDDGEQYRDPGAHLEVGRGEALAAIRREEVQAEHRAAEAAGDVRGLAAGFAFELEGFTRDDQNAGHLVTRAEYELRDPSWSSSAGDDDDTPLYRARFETRPADLPFRPARCTPRPVMRGPQTATVVGPAGAEIHCDKYARVRVQFHWDRLGGNDENSSCFVRVSQTWAGSNWGFIQIPRIGQEVIVEFLEGDPDLPIITGRVYNADQMPPYALPGNATQSGWKSDSSPGGGGFNEIRFEDKKGGEEVYFQAEKDNTILVKNDRNETVQHDEHVRIDNNATHSVGVNLDEDVGNDKTTRVGNNRTVDIGTDETLTIGSNRSQTVGVNETITIGSNQAISVGSNQTETVGAARTDSVGAAESRTVGAAQTNQIGAARSVTVGAAQTHTIGSSDSWTVGADRSASIGASDSTDVSADQSLSVGGSRSVSVGADQSHSIGGGATESVGKALSITVADQVSITCGSASFVMKKDGTIVLKGKDITIDGSGQISIKAGKDVVVKGSKILQN